MRDKNYYLALSDFDLNKEVALALGVSLDVDERFQRETAGDSLQYYDDQRCLHTIFDNYCGDDEFFCEIILEHKISVRYEGGPDELWSARAVHTPAIEDESPQRAAIVVFLLMNGAESEPVAGQNDQSDIISLLDGAKPKLGLEAQGHIPTIEEMLDRNCSWDQIGDAIGWDGATAIEHYIRHLRTQVKLSTVLDQSQPLEERMAAAGMIPLSDMLAGETPLSKFQIHAGMSDMASFDQWLDIRQKESVRARVQLELASDTPEDDELYEWALSHAAAFCEVKNNYQAAKAGEDIAGKFAEFRQALWDVIFHSNIEQGAKRGFASYLMSADEYVVRFGGGSIRDRFVATCNDCGFNKLAEVWG